MIDIKLIRETPDVVKQAATDKGMRVDVDAVVALDARRREIETEFQNLRHEQKQAGEKMAKASPEARAALGVAMKEVKDRVKQLETERDEVDGQLEQLMLRVPQIPCAEAPRGVSADDNVELRTHGAIKTRDEFGFAFKDHLELGEHLKLFDIERGVKIAGSRNYVLTGLGAELHEAVLRLAWDLMMDRGYTPLTVPVLVTDKLMYGTGFFPLHEEEVYRCERDGQALVGTAEVPVTGLHGDEILSADELPKRYVARSTCFRREAGAAGRDTRGLYRIHFFDKLEQVILAPADADLSHELHLEILGNSEALLQALELPYRVVECCTGDMGQGKVRMFDIETWMPSREQYSETHSASRFHDFQARRLNLRYRHPETGKPEFCYTLNNTVVASPRILIPLLELHQQADGSIAVPEKLRPYLRGRERLSL